MTANNNNKRGSILEAHQNLQRIPWLYYFCNEHGVYGDTNTG